MFFSIADRLPRIGVYAIMIVTIKIKGETVSCKALL